MSKSFIFKLQQKVLQNLLECNTQNDLNVKLVQNEFRFKKEIKRSSEYLGRFCRMQTYINYHNLDHYIYERNDRSGIVACLEVLPEKKKRTC